MSVRTLAFLLVIALALVGGATYRGVDAVGERATQRLAEERLSLLSDTLLSTIDRFVAVPDIIGESRSVARLLLAPTDPAARNRANAALERATREVGLAALYVLDDKGMALAASNWREPTSFVGHDYAFRPYFTQAMQSGRGRYYGVGVTTGQAGYFLSSRVRLDEGITGVVVAKVDFTPLQESWTSAGEHVLVSDSDGIVFLSTNPALRYRPLSSLDGARSAQIRQEMRYADLSIEPVIDQKDWPAGQRATRAIDGTAWHMSVVTPWVGKGWAPAGAAALAVMVGLVLILVLVTLRQRRARLAAERAAYLELEARVQARTQDLASALTRLELEITERQRIDGELHRARDELVQAAKLAAMGKAFSGLAHEINQPLAALRTYLSSLRLLISRGAVADAQTNISVMEGAIQRLAGLTGDLRRLARRSEEDAEAIDLGEIARRVAALMKYRFADNGTTLALQVPRGIIVTGMANRLEQVVLNLVLNALDAVADTEDARVDLRVFEDNGRACLSVTDHGPGVPEAERRRLFEPFFTTKEDGVGLGLAISYAIVREHGGTLEYERSGAGETRFLVSLPLSAGDDRPKRLQEPH